MVAAASTTSPAIQLGGTAASSRPLLLWKSEASPARTASPQLRSVTVTAAMQATTAIIGSTSARSSRSGSSARRSTDSAAQAQIAAATAPSAITQAAAAASSPDRGPGCGDEAWMSLMSPIQAPMAAGGTARRTSRSVRRPATACRRTVHTSGIAAARTMIPAATAAPRSTLKDVPIDECWLAAAVKSGYSVIFWKPEPAMANTTRAQTTTPRELRMRSVMFPPLRLRCASAAPIAAFTISRIRARRGAQASRSTSRRANSSW